jgi:hypothetical protein
MPSSDPFSTKNMFEVDFNYPKTVVVGGPADNKKLVHTLRIEDMSEELRERETYIYRSEYSPGKWGVFYHWIIPGLKFSSDLGNLNQKFELLRVIRPHTFFTTLKKVSHQTTY